MGGAHLDPQLLQLQTAQMKFCRKYAAAAVAASREWQGLSCGAAGPLWSTHANDHLGWCLGLNGDEGQPKPKAAARENALKPCRELVRSTEDSSSRKRRSETRSNRWLPWTRPGVFMKPGTGIGQILKETKP